MYNPIAAEAVARALQADRLTRAEHARRVRQARQARRARRRDIEFGPAPADVLVPR